LRMTESEIIALAEKCDLAILDYSLTEDAPLNPPSFIASMREMAAFVREVQRMEREACIAECADHRADAHDTPRKETETYSDGWIDACNEIEWTIRARGGVENG
jgi:hypothetical protein